MPGGLAHTAEGHVLSKGGQASWRGPRQDSDLASVPDAKQAQRFPAAKECVQQQLPALSQVERRIGIKPELYAASSYLHFSLIIPFRCEAIWAVVFRFGPRRGAKKIGIELVIPRCLPSPRLSKHEASRSMNNGFDPTLHSCRLGPGQSRVTELTEKADEISPKTTRQGDSLSRDPSAASCRRVAPAAGLARPSTRFCLQRVAASAFLPPFEVFSSFLKLVTAMSRDQQGFERLWLCTCRICLWSIYGSTEVQCHGLQVAQEVPESKVPSVTDLTCPFFLILPSTVQEDDACSGILAVTWPCPLVILYLLSTMAVV